MLAADKESARLKAVQDIEELLGQLPKNALPKGTEKGKIWTSLSRTKRDDDTWETFNKLCNTLWGENLRDEAGRLPNMETGKYGLNGVANYMKRVLVLKPMNAVHDAVMVKLVRLKDELTHYVYVS